MCLLNVDGHKSKPQTAMLKIGEARFEFISIHPVPASRTVDVTFFTEGQLPVQIEVVDIVGRRSILKTHTAQFGKNTLSLDLQDLSAGIYFLNIYRDQTQNFQGKIIKQ